MAVMLAASVLVTAGGGYLWYRTSMMPQNEPLVPAEVRPPGTLERTDESVPALLFLPAEGKLTADAAEVVRQFDAQAQAHEIVAALLGGEQGGRAPVLKDLTLRALYLDASGTAYLDLSAASPNQKDISASAMEEFLAVYAMVNTLTQNISEIRQVRILVNGREAQTLAGHVDLSRSFGKRADLVKNP